MSSKRHIPLKLKKQIWALPCAVCGCAGMIHVDHIVPVSLGGSNDFSNLQPLCFLCNLKKKNRLTNEQLRDWVRAQGRMHYLRHEYALRFRFANNYDCPSFLNWARGQVHA